MSILISKEIGLKYSLWNLLMCNKLLIFEFLKNQNLFELLIKDSNIAYELKQNKCYEIFKNKVNEIQEQLDYFTNLGYLLKRKESIFSITYDIVIYPYIPVISPIGFTTFTGEIYTLSDNIILTGSELSKFEKISTIICNQIDSGRHSHIRKFTYTKEQLSYSDVYEIKDEYFDAILFSNIDGNIKLYETEPLNLPTNDEKDEIKKTLVDFRSKVRFGQDENKNSLIKEYSESIIYGRPSQKDKRIKRINILKHLLIPYVISKDRRQFTPDQKQYLWDTSSQKICSLCKRKIDSDNFNVKHNIILSQKGKTRVNNAKLVHRKCNILKGK